MKTKHLLAIALITLLVNACGAPAPVQPTRQEQLSEAGLFGEHDLLGVSTESNLSGNFSGGFFVFAGSANGEISATTNYTIRWKPAPDEFVDTTLPRSLFKVKILENSSPKIEFKFKESWLNSGPSFFDDHDNYLYHTSEDDIEVYYDGAKENPNNFLFAENIDVVIVYISSADLIPAP